MSNPNSKYYKMFKAYDTRGTLPDLDENVFYWAGYSLVKDILEPEGLSTEVYLVRDGRDSSLDFTKAMYHGIKDAGGAPIALGLGSSDLLYASCLHYDRPGVMITASHNPKEYNGFKIVKDTPEMIGLDSGLDKIRDTVITKIEAGKTIKIQNLADVEEDEIKSKEVLNFILSKFREFGDVETVDNELDKQGKKLKIAIDAGNGAGGALLPHITNLYKNIEFIPMYWEIDGNFPNHEADPTVAENLIDLIAKVKTEGLDMGVGLDGDADRSVIVDENGKALQGDFLVGEIGKYMIKYAKQNPEAGLNPVVVYPEPNSRAISDAILDVNGIPCPTKQGHTFIKREMNKYKAVYGGENSGHHYYGGFGSMDSGILNMVVVIKIAVLENILPSEITSKWQKRYLLQDPVKYELVDGLTMESVIERLKNHYKDAVFSQLDGISVRYTDWKINIRASNTEPVLKLTAEVRDNDNLEQFLKEKLDEVTKIAGLV